MHDLTTYLTHLTKSVSFGVPDEIHANMSNILIPRVLEARTKFDFARQYVKAKEVVCFSELTPRELWRLAGRGRSCYGIGFFKDSVRALDGHARLPH